MRSTSKLLRVLAVLAAVLLLAVACSKKTNEPGGGGTGTGGGDQGQPKKTVKIAFFGALSGDYKLLVIHGFQAAKLAFQQANQSGQLPVNIQILAEDTQGSPDQAPPLAQKVITDQSVVGIIGPAFSGESAAVGDTFDQAGIPFITQSATDDALSTHGWTHWFRSLGPNSSQAVPEAQYIVKQLKPSCAFVASDGSAYGKGLADIAFKSLQQGGVKLAGAQQTVQPGQKDYSALVTKVKASKCTALFYGGYSPEAGLIRKQLTQQGGSNVTLVGGDGIKDDTYLSTAGPAGNGTIAGCGCADVTSSTDPAATKFVQDYQAAYGTPPGIYAAESWDVAQIYIAAIKAGNTDRQSITDYIANLSGFQGLTKTYDFESNGELVPSSVTTYFYKDQNEKWVSIGTSQELVGG